MKPEITAIEPHKIRHLGVIKRRCPGRVFVSDDKFAGRGGKPLAAGGNFAGEDFGALGVVHADSLFAEAEFEMTFFVIGILPEQEASHGYIVAQAGEIDRPKVRGSGVDIGFGTSFY